jgi:NADP-dependent 3-hydroxy acid dehydrogenase YdfG
MLALLAVPRDRPKTALTNQVALVTGAGSGIGRAIALAIAAQGARMCLVGRTASKLQATARELSSDAQIVPADLADDAAVTKLAAQVDRLDILVLAAGDYANGPIAEASVEEFDALYRSNVHANFLLTQVFLPKLKRLPGQIVFVNSSIGLSARAEVAMVSATNHALKAIADALRAEVNADGVRVLSVHPGRTATPRLAALYESTGQVYRPELLLQPEDVAAVIVNALTLPRTAEVTDISLRPLVKSY